MGASRRDCDIRSTPPGGGPGSHNPGVGRVDYEGQFGRPVLRGNDGLVNPLEPLRGRFMELARRMRKEQQLQAAKGREALKVE